MSDAPLATTAPPDVGHPVAVTRARHVRVNGDWVPLPGTKRPHPSRFERAKWRVWGFVFNVLAWVGSWAIWAPPRRFLTWCRSRLRGSVRA